MRFLKVKMLKVFLISIFGLVISPSLTLAGMSINDFLANAYRSDVLGPELWSWLNGPIDDYRPDGKEGTHISVQLPSYAWLPPKPGMNGTLCFMHETNINDPVRVDIFRVDAGKKNAGRSRSLQKPLDSIVDDHILQSKTLRVSR